MAMGVICTRPTMVEAFNQNGPAQASVVREVTQVSKQAFVQRKTATANNGTSM
jgi:hypothetical protein